MTPESGLRRFGAPARHAEALAWLASVAGTPLTCRCCWPRGSGGVYLGLWKSQPGYALAPVGFCPDAARYAGIRPQRLIMGVDGGLGALAGMVA